MVKRGGGIFTYVADPITGTTKYTTLTVVLILLLVIGIVLAIALPLILTRKDEKDSKQEGGGAVAPSYEKVPGRITIAEVSQAPSAGQAIIYFSQAQASGTVCDTCTAAFDIIMTYSGGSSDQEPVHKSVTATSTSGTVIFDYSVFTPDQPTPGQNININTSSPTSVQLDITARSTNPQTGSVGGSTSFSKTIPYVA